MEGLGGGIWPSLQGIALLVQNNLHNFTGLIFLLFFMSNAIQLRPPIQLLLTTQLCPLFSPCPPFRHPACHQTPIRHLSSSCLLSSACLCSTSCALSVCLGLSFLLFPLDCACEGGARGGIRLVRDRLVAVRKLVRESRASASRRRGLCRRVGF